MNQVPQVLRSVGCNRPRSDWVGPNLKSHTLAAGRYLTVECRATSMNYTIVTPGPSSETRVASIGCVQKDKVLRSTSISTQNSRGPGVRCLCVCRVAVLSRCATVTGSVCVRARARARRRVTFFWESTGSFIAHSEKTRIGPKAAARPVST